MRNTLLALLSLALASCSSPPTYDLAILNGRVMDPETGLDAVRNVGIQGGQIAAVTEDEIAGMEYLYETAPSESLVLTFNPFLPAKQRDFEKFRYRNLEGRVFFGDTAHFEQLVLNTAEFMGERRGSGAFLILSRAQQAHAELFNGMPAGTWAQMERAYADSSKFELVYSNADAQIFRLK